MFERAVSLRRKLLRKLKMHLGLVKNGSFPRKPDAAIDQSKSAMEILGLEPSDDGIPQIKYTHAESDLEVATRSTATLVRTGPDHDVDAVPLAIGDLKLKTPLTIVVPPRTPVPDLEQSPLDTPESSDRAELRETSPRLGSSSGSSSGSSPDSSRAERFQRMQQQLQRRPITKARSMPLSVSDPMRKLRDSYVRIMHKMAHDEASNANSVSHRSAAAVVVSDQPRVFDYLHRRRCPADDEEEEFCRLAVLRTKLNRSQSAV